VKHGPLSDFRNVLYLVWKYLGLPQPTKRQYEMAHLMQHGGDRIGFEAFRGIGKSYVTAAYCIWFLNNNPTANVIVYSATKTRADQFSQFCLKLIKTVPQFSHLIPRPGQRESVVAFDVGPAGISQTPSMTSVGIFGQATGFRADLVVFDDVEIPNNSETQLQREKLDERTREAPGAILKPGGKVIYLGTPQDMDSVYNRFPARGYTVYMIPSEFPDSARVEAIEATGKILSPEILQEIEAGATPGDPTEPTRFGKEELARRRLEYGEAGYRLQFLLDTSLSDADKFPLKISKVIMFPLDKLNAPDRLIYAATPAQLIESGPYNPAMSGDRFYRGILLNNAAFSPWQSALMYIDPAGTGRDECGYAIVSPHNGLIFLRDSGGFKGYDRDTLLHAARIAREYGVNNIVCERNFGDGMFTELLRNAVQTVSDESKGTWGATVEDDDWQSGAKEKRICDILEPVVSGHRLVIDENLIQKDHDSTLHYGFEKRKLYRLLYQFTHVSRERGSLIHDDRLDALAGAVRKLMALLGSDPVKLHEEAVQEAKARAIEELIESVQEKQGIKPKSCAWWA
jgi:hypothetical protein